MTSRVIFLGTGGDHIVSGKQIRATGGLVIQTEGYQFLLDPGPGSVVQAAKFGVNLRATTAIIVTHADLNHAHDINPAIMGMTYGGQDRTGVVICAKSVIEGSDSVPAPLTAHFKDLVERVIAVQPGQRVGIEDIEIQALSTKHHDPTAIGIRFIAGNFSLTLSGDTKYTKEIAHQYEKSDILILNMTHGFGDPSHIFSADDVVKIIDAVKPQVCVVQHFGKKLLDGDPLQVAREIQRKTGVQTIAATDGFSFNPQMYASSTKQQKLKTFSEQEDDSHAEETPSG